MATSEAHPTSAVPMHCLHMAWLGERNLRSS